MKDRLLAVLALLVAVAPSGCASPRGGDAPPGMTPVPAGRFFMGRDEGHLNERPQHRVRLRDYDVDLHEVSAAEFAEFLNAAGNDDERYFTPDDRSTVVLLPARDRDVRDRYAARPGFERYPANNVSWYGADAYCRWKGKRLPTEAEWEKVARGTDRRPFPWGKEPPSGENARYAQDWEAKGFGSLVPVDDLPAGASPYAALNLSGNVQEWVADWYRQNLCDFCNPDWDPNLPLVRRLLDCREGEVWDDGRGECVAREEGAAAAAARDAAGEAPTRVRQVPVRDNPSGPAAGSFKVLRGGSWVERLPEEVSATHRFWLAPEQRFAHTGFRCVATPARRGPEGAEAGDRP